MKLPTGLHKSSVAFSITPMIDIVFLLIIFFLVSAYTSQVRPTKAVDLPTSSEASNEATSTYDLVLTIQADESIWLEQERIGLQQLDEVFAQGIQKAESQQQPISLKLRGDKTVPTRIVKQILRQAQQSGISDYAFTVLPE